MPVNNWIPVAQQFGQFLGQQSDRRRKLMQRAMMQQLPSYIAGELSGAKSQEDVYKKLPELSARMFAIDPEIGAHATQIANQYGQMKLAQMREVEEDTQATQTLDMVKNTFGGISIMNNGKEDKLANVIDGLRSSMKPRDLLRMTDYMMKGQVKEQQDAIFDVNKGRHIMKVYKQGPNGPMGNPETYDIVNGALDDPRTKGFENKTMDPEAAKIISRFNESEFERKQRVKDQYNYAAFSDNLRQDNDMNERKALMLMLKDSDTPITGYVGKRVMEQPDPDKPGKTIKVKVERFFDINGNDITEKVGSTKVFKDDITGEDWKDARQKANDRAGLIMNALKKAGIIDKDRVETVVERGGLSDAYKRSGDLDKITYPSNRLQLFNATSEAEGGVIGEILASPNLSEEEKEDIKKLWRDYWTEYKSWTGSPSGQTPQQSGTKKGIFD